MLKNIIEEFQKEKFIDFFHIKNRKFIPYGENQSHYKDDDDFTDAFLIGEVPFSEVEKLFIYSFRVKKDLTERSGKKAQYEKGKKILKEIQADAGIFIFYDDTGNFRFSLIYTEYQGTRRKFSYFKRFTYFVSPELTNKTFLKQIGEGDFSSLESIKQAFSVEPVTREFYSELQNWYFWAMNKIRFPEDYKYSDDLKKDREIRNATTLIRSITRLIFIWFMKQKGKELIPEWLFSSEKLKGIVKNFHKDKKSSNYYNAILQNLFFATLNQKRDKRKFATEGNFLENRKEYDIKTLYRYRNKFLISEQEVLNFFKDIPFLNGGIFDCLDREKTYIDGFSRNPEKRAIIPDYLFFQKEEERVDLSPYGLGKNKLVRGLIEILKGYNFTIDENTPIDQEVALDPELLGRVFENLLASYNPETATTARKATGSYYTPREIVDYMVNESLFEYLKTKFPDIEEGKIRLLLSYSDEIPEFIDERKLEIIKAVDSIKILDPACGSGAFPMGILHKAVYVLQKLDSENKYWYELQYEKALEASEEIFRKGDKSEREDMLKEINEAFDESINYPDYARKLYLIENCIYGVDIQSIAIQISKLRFFISLVLDQKVDRTKENFGIKPLPNLETKFVAANTLIGLKGQKQLSFRNPDIEKKEKKLKELRHRYFTAKTRTEKLRLQTRDRKIREEIANLLIHDGWGEETVREIASFNLFDQNASADWFDQEWMFGVREGFDIVIGNPPYGNIMDKDINGKNLTKKFVEKNYLYSTTSDIASPFIEKGTFLLNKGGNLFYIITYAITFNKNFSKNRNQIANTFEKTKIYIFDRDRCRVFKNMTQSVSLLMCVNKDAVEKQGIFTSRMFREMPDIYKIEVHNCNDYLLPKGTKYSNSHRLPKLGEEINVKILQKLFKNKEFVRDIIVKNGEEIWIRTSGNYWYNAFYRKPYSSSKIKQIFINSFYKDFFILLMNSSLFYFWFRIYGDGRDMNQDILEQFPLPDSNVILKNSFLLTKARERFMNILFSVFDEPRKRFLTSNIKDEIDLIDLILCTKFYNLNYSEWFHIINYDFEVRGGSKIYSQLEYLVNKILSLTQSEDYLQNSQKQSQVHDYERQIDQLVYKLYGLTENEIRSVEQSIKQK